MKLTCSRNHTFEGSPPCPVCYPNFRTYKMNLRVWLYPGKAAWHFVTLPAEESAHIKERFEGHARGWGSLRVNVTIGSTSWDTSIFPDKKRGGYLLPIKSSVRKKEAIESGDTVTLTIEVRT